MFIYAMAGRVISDFNSTILLLWSVADLGGGAKFSQFHAVFRKVWQNHMLATPWRVGAPGGLASPHTGNPGSATGGIGYGKNTT